MGLYVESKVSPISGTVLLCKLFSLLGSHKNQYVQAGAIMLYLHVELLGKRILEYFLWEKTVRYHINLPKLLFPIAYIS